MKRSMLAGVVIAALFSGSAVAADLRRPPLKAPPPPLLPPIFTWTGCYVGGHIGGLWASKDWHFREVGFDEHHGQHDADGFLGGIQGGCDYQFGGPGGGFVVGIAADYAWANADGEHQRFFTFQADEARFRSEIDLVASVTARLGWGVDRFLIYVKGGFAWERDKFHVRTLTLLNEWDASDTRTGWTIGIGGEYAFTNWVSAFLEANWYNFDDDDIRFNHAIVCFSLRPVSPQLENSGGEVRSEGRHQFPLWRLGSSTVAARY